MENEANEFAVAEIAKLVQQVNKLKAFYTAVQRSMNEHIEYRDLIKDINQATEEYHQE